MRVEEVPQKKAPILHKGLENIEQAAKIYEELSAEDRATILDELQRIEKDEVRAEARKEALLPPPAPNLHKRRKSKKKRSSAYPTKKETEQKLDKVIGDLDTMIDKLEDPK